MNNKQCIEGPGACPPAPTPVGVGGADTAYAQNRAGGRLCPGWNNGTCRKAGPGNTCKHDRSLKHQCSNCL